MKVGEMVNLYDYKSRNLLISYVTAVVFALIGTTIGLYSFFVNGHSYCTPNSFSAVLRTTCNHDLDELVGAKSLGAQPLDKSLASMRLRFGTIDGVRPDRSTSDSHSAFGLSGAVAPIIRSSPPPTAPQSTSQRRTGLGRLLNRRKYTKTSK